MLVPKDLTIENLLSSFVVQNYFVSAIVWKDKEGSEETKKNEKLRIANFKFGKEADEVMCKSRMRFGTAPEKILLCDGCDAGFHCFCLTLSSTMSRKVTTRGIAISVRAKNRIRIQPCTNCSRMKSKKARILWF